jgi:hypothetical protein
MAKTTIAAQAPHSLEFHPMSEAPTKPGKSFGLCVIALAGGIWTLGYWNGFGWYGEDGFPLSSPILWALLPPLAALAATLLGAPLV